MEGNPGINKTIIPNKRLIIIGKFSFYNFWTEVS